MATLQAVTTTLRQPVEHLPTRQLPRREEVEEVQGKIYRMQVVSNFEKNKRVGKIHALCKTHRTHNMRGIPKSRDCRHSLMI